MECKTIICKILIKISEIRLDSRMTNFLLAFKDSIEEGDEDVLRHKNSNDLK